MRRWHVRVCVEDYGAVGKVVVFPHRWQRFYQRGLLVATINLRADDADEQIAAAWSKAKAHADQLRMLEERFA